MKDLDTRFQTLIAVSLFFPVILDNLLKSDTVGNIKITTQYGAFIGILLVSYVIYELTKEKLGRVANKMVNIGILINISSFAMLFITLGIVITHPTPSGISLFAYALEPVLITPSVILIILIIDWYTRLYKE